MFTESPERKTPGWGGSEGKFHGRTTGTGRGRNVVPEVHRVKRGSGPHLNTVSVTKTGQTKCRFRHNQFRPCPSQEGTRHPRCLHRYPVDTLVRDRTRSHRSMSCRDWVVRVDTDTDLGFYLERSFRGPSCRRNGRQEEVVPQTRQWS